MPYRLVMMGTGTFALPTLKALCESSHEVAALVTQPDRRGRGHHRHPHPMKETAQSAGVPVFQPEDVNAPESLDELRRIDADVFIVAAYGQILSAELLSIPKLGAYNLHASLLPKYRGAAPIHYAILEGETETGVTLFRIEPRLDAGPILGMTRTAIGDDETTGELEERLAEDAAVLTLQVLGELEAGTAREQPQTEDATRAPKMRKEMGEIDWTQPAERIARHVRAMQPWPSPYTFLHQPGSPVSRVLILKTSPGEGDSESLQPGSIVADGKTLQVQTGSGLLRVLRLQPAGKREMEAEEFLRGTRLREARFGPVTE